MPRFYLLIGPSGVGKSKLQEKLVSPSSGLDKIVRSISATTRKPREEEHNGIDYFFHDERSFLEMVENDQFLEFKQYSSDYYGTPKKFIDESITSGKDVVGVIEVKGALTIINHYEKSGQRDFVVGIFIYPENFSDLVKRLEDRDIKKNYTADQILNVKKRIESRMKIAIEEIEHSNDFDYRICMEHNHFDKAFEQLKSIVIAERSKEKLDTNYKKRFIREWTKFQKNYLS